MSLRMRKYKWELKLIARCRPETRKLLFKWATSEFIQSIVDVARAVLEGNLPLVKYDKIKIARNSDVLQKITDQNQTVMYKRRLLITKKGESAVLDLLHVANKYFAIPNRI